LVRTLQPDVDHPESTALFLGILTLVLPVAYKVQIMVILDRIGCWLSRLAVLSYPQDVF
jgi:hypothetical protein